MVRIVIFALMLCCVRAFAQPPDSLRNLLNKPGLPDSVRVSVLDELCYNYVLSNQDSSIYFGKEAVSLARKINYKKGLGLALSDLGVAYFYKACLPEAIEVWKEAQHVRGEVGDHAGVASVNIKLGAAYFKLGDFKQSIESQARALQAFEKLDHIEGQTNALNNIAAVFEYQQEYRQALEYHRKALTLARHSQNRESEGISLLNIGNVFYRTQKTDSAQGYWQASLNYLTEAKSPQYCAMAYNNLSEYYTQQNQFDKAASLNEKAMSLRLRLNDKQGYISSLNNQGSLLIKQKNFAAAEKYLSTALDSLKKYPLKIEEQKVLFNLSQLYESTGRYSQALEHFKQYSIVKDTLLNESTRNTTNDLLIKYETEKKEAQLARQDIELAQQQNRLRQTYLLVGALTVVIGLLIAVVLLARGRYKRKAQLIEKEKQIAVREAFIDATLQSQEAERKRVAQDLHDGMGQLITELRFLIGNITPSSTQEERVTIVENGERVLNDMHKEVRAVAFNLMPQTLIQSGLVPALREMALRIEERQPVKVAVTSFDMDARLTDVQEISLYRIVQEWINNIIKYSGASKVEINIVRNEDELSLTLEDDGAGFDPAKLEQSKGHGWKNILSRAGLIRASVDVDTTPGRRGNTLLVAVPVGAAVTTDV
ncbi:MAG: tetratricopeptide repeat protein [Cyclobacteriaceae bacterium]|nr:tetratricopeptide repeat protein [Cyclobacteriaceae bacterium]